MPPLAAKLKARIAADGPMPVDEWMQACLCDPDHGYYMTRDPLGRAGDFTTAPEISQMFGELLGLWAAVVWQQMGSPSGVRLIELGPGRGTLMTDALRATAQVPGFPDALRVHMIEASPVLRKAQQAALAAVGISATWHETVGDVPDGPAIILANEFLDALPVRQLIRLGGAWRERLVDVDGEGFVFVGGAETGADLVPAHLRDAGEGSIFEYSPAVRDVTGTLAARLAAMGGAALLIDYGHDAPGLGETLQALKDHNFADPLSAPGEQDLTAHVDFAMLGDAAATAGARVWGPLGQGELLERLGIAARAATLLAGADQAQAQNIGTARRRLVDADAMGRLFRAVALTHPEAPAPPGFEVVSWA
ncbi:SAM-dependent methyltransferase [Thalassospiraceae bacterium LMO-JJ14]|nr:SAM-dependent methyltransferase [Thalassospiraceae bacterium LMO-JJ14]